MDGMDALQFYLAEMEQVLENGKRTLLGDKVSVDKTRLLDLITDMRLNVPDDIRRAQRLINDHDRLLDDARAKAAIIIEDAEADAKAKVAANEVSQRATEEAANILEEAKRDARDMRINAMDYADELLEKAENQITELIENMRDKQKAVEGYYNEIIEILYQNRQQLRGR